MERALERFVAPGTKRRGEVAPVAWSDVRLTHSAVRGEGHSERTGLEASEGVERYIIVVFVQDNITDGSRRNDNNMDNNNDDNYCCNYNGVVVAAATTSHDSSVQSVAGEHASHPISIYLDHTQQPALCVYAQLCS